MKLYRHGFTLGTQPKNNSHNRAKRGEVIGWSTSASRRNISFLRSVVETELNTQGYKAHALTLTLRTCPPTSDEWGRLRTAFIHRMRRLGLLRLHWVTEWQRRAVPHLHAALWLPETVSHRVIIDHWLDLTSNKYGSLAKGQYVLPITDAVGWFKYLSKHTARGAAHYQRSPESIPSGWSKTGRVWGKTGDWPVREAINLELDDSAFYKLRRIAKGWRVADARSELSASMGVFRAENRTLLAAMESHETKKLLALVAKPEKRRFCQAKGMLTCSDKALSAVRGVSEWVPESVMDSALANVVEQGGQVAC